MKIMLGANCALVALLSANVALASNEVAVAPYFSDWPAIHSVIAKDETIENRIKEILAKMTLDEKIGQMLQPDFREITPEEVAQYKIGSVLNGGGVGLITINTLRLGAGSLKQINTGLQRIRPLLVVASEFPLCGLPMRFMVITTSSRPLSSHIILAWEPPTILI
ncbi:hypothetical protein LNO81_29960 [Klebsiella variicola subsp. variicola]|nr:hypothetical protein [Klebsiella variicola subsp. variicola]